MKLKAQILDEIGIMRAIKRLAHELVEQNENLEDICLLGIRTRGVCVAERIKDVILNFENVDIPTGIIDVTLHRDDLTIMKNLPSIRTTEINFELKGKTVILCDDVLFTGRTIRAAIETILENGRPDKIKLLVLVDRGHREFPIRADYIGKNIPTSLNEKVTAKFKEYDGEDIVAIYEYI